MIVGTRILRFGMVNRAMVLDSGMLVRGEDPSVRMFAGGGGRKSSMVIAAYGGSSLKFLNNACHFLDGECQTN